MRKYSQNSIILLILGIYVIKHIFIKITKVRLIAKLWDLYNFSFFLLVVLVFAFVISFKKSHKYNVTENLVLYCIFWILVVRVGMRINWWEFLWEKTRNSCCSRRILSDCNEFSQHYILHWLLVAISGLSSLGEVVPKDESFSPSRVKYEFQIL